MSEFLERLESALTERCGADVAVADASTNKILRLAREVAHNSERKNAPLATFVIGRFVQTRIDAGVSAQEALDEAVDVAMELLPDGPPQGTSP